MGEKQKGVFPLLGFFAIYIAATAAQLLLTAASRIKKERRPPASALARSDFRIDPALCQVGSLGCLGASLQMQ